MRWMGVAALLGVYLLTACQGNAELSPSSAIGTGAGGSPAASSDQSSVVGSGCTPGAFCVGAAKQRITPAQQYIDGIVEPRFEAASVLQRFHLGGYGVGPFVPVDIAAKSPFGVALGLDGNVCVPDPVMAVFGPIVDEEGPFCLGNPVAVRRFHCQGFVSCGEDDPAAEHIWVRALYLSQPGADAAQTTELLLVSLDSIGTGTTIVAGMKAAIMARLPGLHEENILLGSTHTHAGPDLQGLSGGVPQAWISATLYPAVAEAAVQARERARRATLTYASALDPAFNSDRRSNYRDGAPEPDPRLSILQARAPDGAVLGTLVQYAAHPISVDSDSGKEQGRAPHADYPLGINDTIESATGAVSLYYNGPIADASPDGPNDPNDDYNHVRVRGRCMAQEALAILGDSRFQPCPNTELDLSTRQLQTFESGLVSRAVNIRLPITGPGFLVYGLAGQFNRYYDFTPTRWAAIPGISGQFSEPAVDTPQLALSVATWVNRISIGTGPGALQLVTIPGEATNTFGQYIRGLAQTQADSDHVMFLGLTQSALGYILPEEEFSYIDESGRAGTFLPFTTQQEYASLGPLTAPLLRMQAYNPLFEVAQDDPRNLPPSLLACEDPGSQDCLVGRLLARVDYVQANYAYTCRKNGVPEEICQQLDPQTPLAQPCREAGGSEDLCDIAGDPAPPVP